MSLDFHTLDVFTDRRFAGNPLAVVLGADGLDTQRMQSIAREFNLSETVFVLQPVNPAHSARIRIFTPTMELPFAGHPTVGAAVLLAEQRLQGAANDHDSIIVLEETAGLMRVGVRFRAGHAAFAEFDAPKLPEETGTVAPADSIAAALGLIPSEIGFANHRPVQFGAGNNFAFVPVTGLEAIGRARVQASSWPAAFSGRELVGAFLYCRDTVHNTSGFHARMFAPESGMPEDAASGSAVIGLAGVIQRFDALPDGAHKRVIEQGYEMGRPSHIALSVVIGHGRIETVRIGGSVVRVTEGRIVV